MRTLFGCLAGLLCVVSVALAARYGYKGAHTEVDGVISNIALTDGAASVYLPDL